MELFLMVLVTVLFPFILLFGFYVVNPREEVVVLNFGKHVDTKTTEGIRWSHPAWVRAETRRAARPRSPPSRTPR